MSYLLRIYASGDYGKIRQVTLIKKETYLREFFSDCYLWFYKEHITVDRLNTDFKLFFESEVIPDYARKYIFHVGL